MKIILFALSFIFLSGCANFGKDLKAFLKGTPSGQQPSQSKTQSASQVRDDVVRFSDVKEVPFDDQREYRSISRKEFEDRELRSDNSGSLWTMEGQDSYLFAENNVRLPGDLINVALEGQPEKQLSTKAKVIKDLTKKIEAKRKLASQANKPAAGANPEAAAAGAEGAAAKPDPAAGADANKTADAAGEEEMDMGGDFDVKSIPTRIVEKLSDGNYRVKGSQNFMIGAKEYKVIVTGLVKPADVNNNTVESSKMLDSKFDIVRSAKR